MPRPPRPRARVRIGHAATIATVSWRDRRRPCGTAVLALVGSIYPVEVAVAVVVVVVGIMMRHVVVVVAVVRLGRHGGMSMMTRMGGIRDEVGPIVGAVRPARHHRRWRPWGVVGVAAAAAAAVQDVFVTRTSTTMTGNDAAAVGVAVELGIMPRRPRAACRLTIAKMTLRK